MEIITTYSVKIKHYNKIFKNTVALYRQAVDFLINVCLEEWDSIQLIENIKFKKLYVEKLIHKTKQNQKVKYDFDTFFYKFPSYLRRSAIAEAIGKVSSYKSNYKNWELNQKDKEPGKPIAGNTYPCLYKGNVYQKTDTYTAKIKVFVRNTWDWLYLSLRKSDVDYILNHCSYRKEQSPTLQKRGKEWYLDFPFKEYVKLNDTKIKDRRILAVDLGINTPATISIMESDGTILDRLFCKLPKEQDSLNHSINRIKKAQKYGNKRTPRLWAKVNGINKDVSVKTAQFIIDAAALYDVDVIVFEYLDRHNMKSKLKGKKKQKIHLWRSNEIQRIVAVKAHGLDMRISRINAKYTSQLAYDGSGFVLRGKKGGHKSFELCTFQTGKVYNCDLSASYNIGARYFIRELLKTFCESKRLQMEAKVPSLCRRSTCTLSTLISLNAAMSSL